ncbi:MAG: hypothetical protein CMJ22_00140 [Phycisphaerae bacterium]|nr:hypothetical protein [Phycisphaerae bacterium]
MLCAELYRRVFGESTREAFGAWLRIDENASVLKHSSFGPGRVQSDLSYLDDMVRECFSGEVPERYFRDLASCISGNQSLYETAMARIMSRPAVLAHAGLLIRESGSDAAADRLVAGLQLWLPRCRNSKQLCAIGFAALALGRTFLLEEVVRVMGTSIWRMEDSALLPLVPGKPNIERSLLASGLVAGLAIHFEGADFSDLSSVQDRIELVWEGFGFQPIATAIEGADFRFFDPGERLISASLLDNWLKMIEQPHIDHGQLCISDSRYDQAVEALEAMWGRIVDAIAAEAGQAVVRIRPWPAGSDFAVSVRYDVDRPVPEGRIDRILEIQSKVIGGMCGSWFFLEGAHHNEAVRDAIRGHGQEEGVHSTRLSRQSCVGKGVTAHSSQHSEYFSGRRSLLEAEAGGAIYSEQMNHLATGPRPAWLGERASELWAFPLHFPVEGSVGEQGLSYFARYAAACIDQRNAGAHVVLGAHPDCEPELIRLAVLRCGLVGGWAVTMKDVLARARALSTPGDIKVEVRGSQLEVWSRNDVADVVFEFIPPGADLLVLHGDLKADEFVTLRSISKR